MTQEKTFDGLIAIADEIEAVEGPWVTAWGRIMNPDDVTPGSKLSEDLFKVTEELNAFISARVDKVAEITGNSVPAIRMRYAPKDELGVWFGATPGSPASRFLRKVAQHKSFNTDYWAAQERRDERDAFFAKADPSAPVVSVDEAAAIMKAGGVPNVAAYDFLRDTPPGDFEKESSLLSRLERAMVRAGLLEQYDRMYADRVSTTQSVAFVFKNDQGDADGVYWAKGVARQRSENIALETVAAESPEVPRG